MSEVREQVREHYREVALDRQAVDLRGVVDVDVILLGHQHDLRIAQDSHAVFFDGFPVVRDHVFGGLAHVLNDDLGHRLPALSRAPAHRCSGDRSWGSAE
ncbi:MAG: hypothetical protein ACRDJB_12135 [Actinomycetota bacterium]